MRYRWKGIFLAAAAACLLTGCQGAQDGEPVHNPVPEQQEQTKHPEAEEALGRALQAVESQFPDRRFEPLPEEETEKAVSFFKDSYLFSGRKSEDGYSYILGICLIKENPLEGLTCGKDWSGAGYSASQFHNGQFLLLEKGDTSSGISSLSAALEEGMEGISYLEEAEKRGAFLVPPQEEGFWKTYSIQNGKLYAEFVREETAPEAQGFSPEFLEENGAVVKAELSGTFENGERTESLGNREDLEKLGALLSEAEKEELPMNEYFPGKLTLTMESEETKELWLSFPDSEGSIPELAAGGSSFYTWDGEQSEAVWRLFGTVYGFGAYGEQIWMEMDPRQVTAEDSELSFILHNDTGRSIQYILSPAIEKKTEKDGKESWEQVESLAGFCGYLTELSEESVRLAVPWKGSFAPDGPGTYRLRIQVLSEEELRFGVEAEFEVADNG